MGARRVYFERACGQVVNSVPEVAFGAVGSCWFYCDPLCWYTRDLRLQVSLGPRNPALLSLISCQLERSPGGKSRLSPKGFLLGCQLSVNSRKKVQSLLG